MSAENIISFQTVSSTKLMDDELKRRKLPDAVVKAMKLEPLTLAEVSERGIYTATLVGATGAIAIHTPQLEGGWDDAGRVRFLGDCKRPDADGVLKPFRYSQARGVSLPMYFANTPARRLEAVLDTTVGLLITEGEFKAEVLAWALNEAGLGNKWLVVGLRGVTMHGPNTWLSNRQGLHHELRQFKLAEWHGGGIVTNQPRRQVTICFDWDPPKPGEAPRPKDSDLAELVGLEEDKLAAKFHALGAKVDVVRLYDLVSAGAGDKLSADDMLIDKSYGLVREMLRSAKPWARGLNATYEHPAVAIAAMSTRLARYETSAWLDTCTGAIYQTAPQAAAATIGYRLTHGIPSADGGKKLVTREAMKWDFVLSSEHFAGVGFIGVDPEKPRGVVLTPEGMYNVWRGWGRTGKDGDVSKWLDWCSLFFSRDPEVETYFHDWVGWLVQHPGRRHTTSIVFSSKDEGSGKSFTAESVANMLGMAHCIIVGSGDIFDGFNADMAGKVLCVANEPSSDNDDHSAKWKDARTAPFITINKKYGAKYRSANMLNFIATTNKAYVTKVSDKTRRELVYKPEGLNLKEVGRVVRETSEWLDGGGFEVVLKWYEGRDVSLFNPKAPAPETAGRDAMIEDSCSPLEYDVKELLERLKSWMGEKGIGGVLLDTASFTALVRENHRGVSTQSLRRVLSTLGIEKAEKTFKWGGAAHRCYSIGNWKDHATAGRDGDLFFEAILNRSA